MRDNLIHHSDTRVISGMDRCVIIRDFVSQGYKKIFEPVYDLILDLLNEKECLDGATGE